MMNSAFTDRPQVRVRLTLLTKEEGGRGASVHDQSGYRPHIVIGDRRQGGPLIGEHGEGTENYLGVCFLGAGRVLELGHQYEVDLALLYYPHVNYDAVVKGAAFTVREGHRVVAFGEVLTDPEIKVC